MRITRKETVEAATSVFDRAHAEGVLSQSERDERVALIDTDLDAACREARRIRGEWEDRRNRERYPEFVRPDGRIDWAAMQKARAGR